MLASNGIKTCGLIFKHSLYYYFLIPIVLNIAFFSLGIAYIDDLSNYLLGIFNFSSSYWWIQSGINALTEILVWLISMTILFLTGGYITLILMSPVLAFISEKTEYIITGKTYEFSMHQWLFDIYRGISISFRNMVIQLAITFLLFVASFFFGLIPVVGWAIAFLLQVLLFLISCYFYGFTFIDYTCERRKIGVRQSVRFMKQNKKMAVQEGLFFCLILLIPYFGVYIAGFAAIVQVVSTTITIIEKEKNGSIHFENYR